MKERLYLTSLYEYYGELLTEKQKEYFEDYYYNNLTLSEISENNGISRSAVGKSLKEIESKLKYYEEVLRLEKKVRSIKEIVNDEHLLDKILEVLDN